MTYLIDILAWIGGFSIVAFLIGAAGNHADEKEVSRTRKILEYQLLIIQNQQSIMAQFEDISAALDKVDQDIAAVAAKTGSATAMTDAQAAEVVTRIAGQSAKLEAIVTPPAA
jgi:TolA-binding protein